uniref:Nucleotid_trans domain-containing protein n=1 Tax=Panagrellus redivivus TaxID=6233 RepID=A0A7E4W5B9_PANRE
MLRRFSAPLRFLVRLVCLVFACHFLKAALIVRYMNQCADREFSLQALAESEALREIVASMPQPFGVMMLNKHVVDMTLNWLCNTAHMPGVHERMLFFTLDDDAAQQLLDVYPYLKTFTWSTECLQSSFRPLDGTYMSFFLLRTNLIRTLSYLRHNFWMLQADTFWKENLFNNIEYNDSSLEINVALDQQGYSGISNTRKKQMNGANFLVFGKQPNTQDLFDDLHYYQTHFYVTDPDAMKVVCASKRYHCNFIDHSIVSGWEWIYGPQRNAPDLMQMDGETSGGKVRMLKQYKLWFLDDDHQCIPGAVAAAKYLADNGMVPRLYSNSKVKQKLLLAIGEFFASLPLFGRVYRVYGGLPSLYLQVFS